MLDTCMVAFFAYLAAWPVWSSFFFASLSGLLGAAVYLIDQEQPFLSETVPDPMVFGAFMGFASLLASFRTAHAIQRYMEAADFLHQLYGSWFDTASTLISFCRISEAPGAKVREFQGTLARLISLMNALCLTKLQGGEALKEKDRAFRFALFGVGELDQETTLTILTSGNQVECVFQLLQQCIMDNTTNGVLSVPPPILSRSIQEMGMALRVYHEALKLTRQPIPKPYKVFTAAVLLMAMVCVPWIMAMFSKGVFSAFNFTFIGVFLLWYVNFVADVLENPFKKESSSLQLSEMQEELNQSLHQLLLQADLPTPTLNNREASARGHHVKRTSLSAWMDAASERLGLASDGCPKLDVQLVVDRMTKMHSDQARLEHDEEPGPADAGGGLARMQAVANDLRRGQAAGQRLKFSEQPERISTASLGDVRESFKGTATGTGARLPLLASAELVDDTIHMVLDFAKFGEAISPGDFLHAAKRLTPGQEARGLEGMATSDNHAVV